MRYGLSDETISKIKNEIDELILPYGVDIFDYANISNAELREHIDRIGVMLFFRK